MTQPGMQMISVTDLAKRFGTGPRWAAARMREMRHVSTGGQIFTTEEWLGEWLAANAVPAMNWPPTGEILDPLEEAVSTRVIQIVGELCRSGKLRAVQT